MKHFSFILGLVILLLAKPGVAKNRLTEKGNENPKDQISCVAFYNLENLFDTIDNNNVNDEEYTPTGAKLWDTRKYKAKLEHMSYAISQIGLDYCPAGISFMGVSEIENRGVLEDLVKQPALANRSLKIVHYDSPDRRGVDVALLYNPKLFVPTSSKPYGLHTSDPNFRTRDQLLVSGYLQGEKVHIIVNHWPSRTGGELASRPKRNAAAALTRSIADSLLKTDPKAKIFIMGDLNDNPADESCAAILDAKENASDVKAGGLYNTLWKASNTGVGSLSYNNQWDLFDQHIISYELVNGDRSKLQFWKSEIFNRAFLTQQEGKYKGTPWRTHSGKTWKNGYSDHYPTLLYLTRQTKQ